MGEVAKTIKERQAQHGPFHLQAAKAQELKGAIRNSPNWDLLPAQRKEALEMIAHKVARVLVGSGESRDSWHDIAGYATLVADEMLRDGAEITQGGDKRQPAWVDRVLSNCGLPEWAECLIAVRNKQAELIDVHAAGRKAIEEPSGRRVEDRAAYVCTVARALIGDDERIWELEK